MTLYAWVWLAGCPVPFEEPVEPPEPEPVADLYPWPETPPDPVDDPGCTGAVLAVWLDDPDVAEVLLPRLALLGGRAEYHTDLGQLSWGPSGSECGYLDREAALIDRPVFLENLIDADPAFADYPYDLVDPCPCTVTP